MPNTDSVTLVKTFDYRGKQEEWSNNYHLEGTTPTTDALWKALAFAIFTSEKQCYGPQVKLVRAYGYSAGNEHSVAQIDFSLDPNAATFVGTLNMTAGVEPPGDVAVMLRARVGLSSKGKKVYVRKYFHGSLLNASNQDAVAASALTGIAAHGAKMLDGTLPGGMKWCGPQGADPVEPTALPFATTRTLKRRGKRP